MRTGFAACAVAAAALLAAPAHAEAARWRGQTEQGRLALVRTAADGTVAVVRIRWRARCRPGDYVGGTAFERPLDTVTARSFTDAGRYRARLDGGFRARLRVRVNGTLSAGRRRWRGSFRVRAAIYRRGRRVDTCRLSGLRWSARRRR
jgi:hypothetical protein